MAKLAGLAGRRILLVEDDFFIVEEMRREFVAGGAQVVGPASSVNDALALIGDVTDLDGAVLDVKLHDETVYPVADILREKGVPFVFITGYDQTAIVPRYADVRRYEKPAEVGAIAAALFG